MHLPFLNFRMEQKYPLLLVTHNLRAFAARQTESLRGVDRLICEGEEEGRNTYPLFMEGKTCSRETPFSRKPAECQTDAAAKPASV